MVPDVVLRLSWICLLLCSSGFGFPAKKDSQGGGWFHGFQKFGGGSGLGSGGSGSGFGSGFGSGGAGSGSGSGGAGSGDGSSGFPVFGGFPWDSDFLVVPQFFDRTQVRLPRFFFSNAFDFTGLPAGSVVVQSRPASQLTQSSNAYQRAKSVLAHSKYDPNEVAVVTDDDGGQVKQWPKKKW